MCILQIQVGFSTSNAQLRECVTSLPANRRRRIVSMGVTQHYRGQQCNITLLMVAFCETSFTQEIGDAQVT